MPNDYKGPGITPSVTIDHKEKYDVNLNAIITMKWFIYSNGNKDISYFSQPYYKNLSLSYQSLIHRFHDIGSSHVVLLPGERWWDQAGCLQ